MPPKPAKQESYLKLAALLLRKGNTIVTERSVAYLLELSTKLDVCATPDLPWHRLIMNPHPQLHVDFSAADQKILSRLPCKHTW